MENSKIEWTDHTFNPWIGCTKVSAGCANCYAEELMDKRYGKVKWGRGNPRQRTSVANWKQPVKWNRDAAKNGTRPRVFCASLADWLDDEVPIEWLADLLKLIHETPNLDWLLLSKRPENWQDRVCAAMQFIDRGWLNGTEPRTPAGEWIGGWIEGAAPHRGLASIPQNVWPGTSVENQEAADKRISELMKIPARVRFLSCEPLLGPLRIFDALRCDVPIHWVIAGGESGHNSRQMQPEWARSLRDQCQAAGVAYLFKQWGEFDAQGRKVGKKASGRELDGRTWDELPDSAALTKSK